MSTTDLNFSLDDANIEAEIAYAEAQLGAAAKVSKVAGYAAVPIDVGAGIYENIQNDAPTDKIVSDAVVDTAFGVGGIGASMLTGSLIGSAVPGVGTVAGALVGGLAYMGLTEVWSPGGQSLKDRAKDSVYDSLSN